MGKETSSTIFKQLVNSPVGIISDFIANKVSREFGREPLRNYILEIQTGKTPPMSNPEYYLSNDIEWIKPSDIGVNMILKATSFISLKAVEDRKATIYKPNTILFNCIGNLGRLGIVKKRASSNQQITGILFNENVYPEYVYYYFLTRENQFYKESSKTTLPIINQKGLGNLDFVCPTLSLQKEIVRYLDYCKECLDNAKYPTNEEFDLTIDIFNISNKVFKAYYNQKLLLSEYQFQLTQLTNLNQAILQEAVQGKLVLPAGRQAGKTLTMNPPPRLANKQCWYTYIIECEDGSFYKGFTNNLLNRYDQHCKGVGAEYTKMHKPKQLYYWEMHYSLDDAVAREKYLKSGSGREWFKREVVDKPENWEPATELLKRIKAEKEKSGKKEKPLPPIKPEEIPFEIPNSWVWCRLGDVTNYGSSPKAEPTDLRDETWVLDLEDIEKTTSDLLCKIRFNERNSLSTKSIFKTGDVLYSKLRPYLDKVIVADEDGVCTTEILPLKCYAELNPLYLRFALKNPTFIQYVNGKTKGMKMPRLGTNEGKMAIIPLPPLSEQRRIVAEIEKQFAKTKQLKENIIANQQATEQLLKALLAEAFKGGKEQTATATT